MKYKSAPVGLTLGDGSKVGALFYPRIFPYVMGDQDPPSDKVVDTLLPVGTKGIFVIFQDLLSASVALSHGREDVVQRRIAHLAKLMGQERANDCREQLDVEGWIPYIITSMLFENKVTSIELFSPGTETESDYTATESDPAFVLSNLDIIDTDSLSWEEIASIRADTDAAVRLRRLRTFVFEEFDGKPLSYIEDKLGVVIEDYKAAALKHGVNLRKATLSAVSSEKVMCGAAAGVLAAITGAAMPIAAAIGASATLAGALIEIRTLRGKYLVDQSVSPVRYLIDLETVAAKSHL